MRQRVSLQSLVTLSVLAVGMVSGTVGLAYAYWHARQSLQSTVGITFQEIARQSADKAALLLAREIEWVQRLAALPDLQASVAGAVLSAQTARQVERWRDAQHGYFHSLAIVRTDGQLVGGRPSESTREFYSRQPWWVAVVQEGQSWAGPLTVDAEGHGYWEVAVPIGERGGSVRGALKVVIGTDHILSSILGSRLGRTGHIMLLDKQGTILACSVLAPTLHRSLPTPVMQSGTEGSAARWAQVDRDSHGRQGSIIGMAPVVLSSQVLQAPSWSILVQQDPSETFEPLVALLEKLAAFWIGTSAFIVWLRWRLGQRIVRPLGTLIQRVNRLADGETPASHPSWVPGYLCGIEEIDRLAASFDDLAQRLESASQAKAQYVRRLEQANVDLATSEEHYRLLWDHSVDTKILVDPFGIIQAMNGRGEVTLGRPVSMVQHRPVIELVHEAERGRLQVQLNRVRESGVEVAAGLMRVPVLGGELTMEIDCVPVTKTGRIESIMVQLRDLTEQKTLEQQLLRSERLASLSQFASMFAHDIRNPLAGIKKTLEWLSGRPEMAQDLPRRCLEDLRFTTDLLLGMINDMLDVYQEHYSGLPLSRSAVATGQLLQETLRLFHFEAEAQAVRFVMRRPSEDVWVWGDGRRLQRVLINLLHNALKYSPPDGTITITLQREEPSKPQPMGSGAPSPGSMVTMCIEDEGPGIAVDDVPHVFDMFFRKKDGQDYRIGRGLGLHFCRLVVEAHGGRITAGNRRAGGAILTVALPVGQEQTCLSPS